MSLTPRQISVLHAVETLTRQMGYPPTVEEIASYAGICPQRAHQHLDALEQRHAIRREHGKARTIRALEENLG